MLSKPFIRVLCAIAFTVSWGGARAHTSAEMKFECPLDHTKFTAVMDMSGTQFGTRLDLKPLGPIAAPWAVPVCPKCRLVLYQEQFTDGELERLRTIVYTPAYMALDASHSSHYLLAILMREMGKSDHQVAHTFLQASWQVEDQPDRYQQYLGESLRHFLAYTASIGDGAQLTGDDLEAWRTARFLIGELHRLRGEMRDAAAVFEALKDDPLFQDGIFPHLVEVERGLILDEEDTAPHEMPPPGEDAAAMLEKEHAAKAHALEGWTRAAQHMDVGEVLEGYVNGSFKNLFMEIRFKKNPLVDLARWQNPLVRSTPILDWDQFVHVYDQVAARVQHIPWIRDWKASSAGRSIEVAVQGLEPFHEEMPEWNVYPAWRHAGLPGLPDVELTFRINMEACATVLLGASTSDTLILSAGDAIPGIPSPGGATQAAPHWLDAEKFFFHPLDDDPTYIVVHAEGTFEKRHMPRSNKRPGDGPGLDVPPGVEALVLQHMRANHLTPTEDEVRDYPSLKELLPAP